MEELLVKLIDLVQRLGAAGAAIFAILWWLEKRDHKETKSALADSQEKRIAQALTVTAVVEGARSQMALVLGTMKELQEVVRKLLDRRSRGAE